MAISPGFIHAASSSQVVKQYSSRYDREVTGVSTATLSRLEKYHWPGNIKELHHAMK